MKTKLFFTVFVVFMLSTAISHAQNKIEFEYDNSGNCVVKYKTIVMSKSKQYNNKNKEDSQTEQESLIETSQISDLTLKIYPNPTKGNLKIEILGELPQGETYTVALSDMSGKVIINKKTSEKGLNIDISTYSDGVYMLRVKYAGKQEEWKIIKN